MKNPRILITWSLLSLLALLPVSAAPAHRLPPTARQMAHVLTDKDNGKSVTLRRGEMLTVRLRENPTTGYSWAIMTTRLPLTLVSDKYIPSQHNPGVVGAGGIREFNFKANKLVTRAGLKFFYRRPWEKDKVGATQFNIWLTVMPARRR